MRPKTNNIPHDERLGLPSASGMERIVLCPGSWRLEKDIKREPSAEAQSGTLIHDALAGSKAAYDALDERELDIYNSCLTHRREALLSVLGTLTPQKEWVERRVWYRSPETLQPIVSGKFDYAAQHNGRWLVVDYKTGPIGVSDASENIQLATLAVVVADEMIGAFEGAHITVAIIQPLTENPLTMAQYDQSALTLAAAAIEAAVGAAMSPDAPLVPGEKQCRYCAAKPCSALAKSAEASVALVQRQAPDMNVAVAAMRDDELADAFLRLLPVVEIAARAIREEAKRRLQAGAVLPGLALADGRRRETIINPTTVFERALALGVGQEQFLKSVRISKTALKDELKTATAKRGAQLESLMDELLDGCVEVSVDEPSVVAKRP